MRRSGLLLLLALAGATAGCAYYNGMYNAKRLAGQARKAERDGRNFEAASLWGQVGTKAESVLVRHPDSKWAEEARLLKGTAYLKLKDCGRALPELETVMTAGRDAELVEQAAMMAGECRLRLDDPVGASSAYARLLDSRNAGRRDVARWAHGRSLLLAGDYAGAVSELSTSQDPRARGSLAAALAGQGRTAEAMALADSLLQPPDTAAPWLLILGLIGQWDAESASALTGRMAADPGMPAGLRARLLAEDAARLAPIDSARAGQRLSEAERVGAGTTALAEVVLIRARLLLRHATDAALLRDEAQSLSDNSEVGGALAPSMLRISAAVVRALDLSDSAGPGAPQGDMRLFLAAELARDSAGAIALAEQLFHRIPDQWPGSPYGAKAVMALKGLDPALGDSLDEVLLGRYASSPYVLVAMGGNGAQIVALEDSLRRYAVTLSRPARAQPARPGQRPRAQPTRPADDLR